jgi:hypothetical protein
MVEIQIPNTTKLKQTASVLLLKEGVIVIVLFLDNKYK